MSYVLFLKNRLLIFCAIACFMDSLVVSCDIKQTDRGNPFLISYTDINDCYNTWGNLKSYNLPRGYLGTKVNDSILKRKESVGSLSNSEFTSKQFIMPNSPLRLNLDVLHGKSALTQAAYLMVEVLNSQDQVIKGFEKEKCIIGDKNKLDLLLKWDSRTTKELSGQEVSLRFYMRDARLYSVHTKQYSESSDLVRLSLNIQDTILSSWDSTNFNLSGESIEGDLVTFYGKSITFEVSDPSAVIAKTDKREVHDGILTVHKKIQAPQNVEVTAMVEINGKIIKSNKVKLNVTPKKGEFELSDFKLLFMQKKDIYDVAGNIDFEANSLEYYADTHGLPTTEKAMVVFNKKNGKGYTFWGSSRGEDGFVFRSNTEDAINFETQKINTSMHPQHFMSMTYSPKLDEYLAFERDYPNWYAHVSSDGLNFVNKGLAYKDHDVANLVWDSLNNRFISYNLSFELLETPRKYNDGITPTKNTNNRGRRIFTMRTSADGITWNPNQEVHKDDPKSWLDEKDQLFVPDETDPPEMEFYWMDAFPYGDRYVGLLMSYAPSPSVVLEKFPYDPYPSKHGPHLNVEWCFSDDLIQWERPYRDVKATTDWRIYFANKPLIMYDRILFITSNQLYNPGAQSGQNIEIYSLPIDRIASVGSKNTGAFSTKIFKMPKSPLLVNINGTVEVEIIDDFGKVVPGFEREKCSIDQVDALHYKLDWDGKLSSQLEGEKVALRFYLEDARIFGVHNFK